MERDYLTHFLRRKRKKIQRNIEIAEKYDFRNGKRKKTYLFKGRPVERTSITFQQDTPLYCDWQHFSRIGDGRSVESLDASAFGFGINVGWSEDKGEWKTFEQIITDIDLINDISGSDDATVAGYVNFIVHNDKVVTESMEGDQWFLSVITTAKVTDSSELEDVEWIFCYFRDGCDYFSFDEWRKS